MSTKTGFLMTIWENAELMCAVRCACVLYGFSMQFNRYDTCCVDAHFLFWPINMIGVVHKPNANRPLTHSLSHSSNGHRITYNWFVPHNHLHVYGHDTAHICSPAKSKHRREAQTTQWIMQKWSKQTARNENHKTIPHHLFRWCGRSMYQ